MNPILHWLWLHGGLSSGNSPWYLFPSGIGSIIIPPLITLAGIGVLFWWHHRCEVAKPRRCYRYARKTTAAGHRACKHHHPEGKLTAADVTAAHVAATSGKPDPSD